MPKIHKEKAKMENLGEILALMKLNPRVYSKIEVCVAEESVRKLISKQNREAKYFVAKVAEKIVGCAGYSKRNDTTGVYTLNWLVVHPDYKRRGIATDLYELIEARLQELDARLIILSAGSNEGNKYFYKKMGFTQSVRIPKYYSKTKGKVWYYKHL